MLIMRAQLTATSVRRALLLTCVLEITALPCAHTLGAQANPDPGVPTSVRALSDGRKEGAAQPQRRRSPSRGRSARRTPVRTARAAVPMGPAWTSPKSAPELAGDLGGILHSRTFGGQWGVIVVSVTRGDTLYSEQPDLLLKPASTMKLMTTALALERFGPDHTFDTDVLRAGPVSGGVLDGNLYLRGGGDPTLSLRFWQGESPTDALAGQVASAGIRRVKGDVVADESAFDAERIPFGWKSSYLMSAYAAPISALSL